MIAALFLSAAGPLMRRSWLSALCVSLLVWFVTAPQVALAFREVPVAGLFINAVAIPLFALIFPAVFLFSLPSMIGLPFGCLIAEAFEYVLKTWEILSQAAVDVVTMEHRLYPAIARSFCRLAWCCGSIWFRRVSTENFPAGGYVACIPPFICLIVVK